MILVDTQVIIWILDPKRVNNIGKKARHLIEGSNVYVSSISISEINIKSMIGKLPELNIDMDVINKAGLLCLDYSIDHSNRLKDFQSLAKHDPFDRMLLAQAAREDMLFLTADQTILGLELPYVVDVTQ